MSDLIILRSSSHAGPKPSKATDKQTESSSRQLLAKSDDSPNLLPGDGFYLSADSGLAKLESQLGIMSGFEGGKAVKLGDRFHMRMGAELYMWTPLNKASQVETMSGDEFYARYSSTQTVQDLQFAGVGAGDTEVSNILSHGLGLGYMMRFRYYPFEIPLGVGINAGFGGFFRYGSDQVKTTLTEGGDNPSPQAHTLTFPKGENFFHQVLGLGVDYTVLHNKKLNMLFSVDGNIVGSEGSDTPGWQGQASLVFLLPENE